MNPDNGHLVRGNLFEQMLKEGLVSAQDYEPIPQELNRAAERKLAGRDEAHVSLTSGGKLSKWAAKRRKARRKMQKKSRQRNR